MESIKSLTDDELMAKLKKHGQQTGPITASTRSVFEQKLSRCLDPSLPAPLAESEDIIPASTRTSSSSEAGASTNLPTESTAKESVFYGVQLPMGASTRPDRVLVFSDKQEALRQLKLFPGSRFKPFFNQQEAENFSRGLLDPLSGTSPRAFTNHIKSGFASSKPVPVESSAFRSVKTQDLVQLRKLLEKGDIHEAQRLIWSNPRYLISNGDTPTILQEGFRYNALHVSAMKNQPESARLILETIQNPRFMELLYPGEPEQTCYARIEFLVDLYLNTPDKGLGESALHFACKFGHAEVVKVLSAHPKTERNRKNKYGDTPADVICSRSKVPAGPELKNRIKELLEDQYYVHLWRSEDNSTPPHVAEPWSPTADAGSTMISPAYLASPRTPVSSRIPMTASPRESPVGIKAVAGPMSAAQAKRFRKTWLTPPCNSPQERKHIADVKRKDSDKGLERVGRHVAHTMGISWSEYWDFLGSYTDFCTKDGLDKLETYLKERRDCLQRQQALECDLNTVSTKLNQLTLSSPASYSHNSSDAKPGGSNVGAELVVKMNSDFWQSHNIPLIDDDSASDASTESFHTAFDQTDSDTESLFTPPETPPNKQELKYFIYGSEPSKIDLDVVRSLEEAEVDENQYPCITEWRQQVKNYREEDAARWGTPHHIHRAVQYHITASANQLPYSPLLESSSPNDLSQSLSHTSSDSESSLDSTIRVNLMSAFQAEKSVL